MAESARQRAAELLLRMHREQGYSQILLDRALREETWTEADRALLSRLVYGAEERRLTLDWFLGQCTRAPLKRAHPAVLEILRVGAYQLLFMDRIPASAAVNEAVKIAKTMGQGHAAGFVNGVLRSLDRRREELWRQLPEGEAGEEIRYSCPRALIRLWREAYGEERTAELLAALNEQYPDNNFVQNEVSNVDATIGKEFLLKSVVALVAACVLILLYVAYRFRKIGGLKAGSTAIVALLHDMFVVFGVFVLLRIPLNGNFIAALLTILGYSINDTVVIYDRIRENSALYGKKQMSLVELVNLSVNQSFARSLMTSITTCLALGVVCVVSVIYRLDSIYSFAFPLLFGMVSGVYSTICIATPLWVDWKNKKKAAKKA